MAECKYGAVSEGQLKNIMDMHGEDLIRLAYLYVKGWSAAEDIIQDVFITYYLKADQFEQRSSLKTYLEISKLLDCSENTVKTRLRRAKDILKKKVDQIEREGLQDEQF